VSVKSVSHHELPKGDAVKTPCIKDDSSAP